MKATDVLLVVVTFILFVLAVYLFASDPVITPQMNYADGPAKGNSLAAKSKWQYIVIHHSASGQGSAETFDSYYRNQKGLADGLVYHFVIGNGTNSKDGQVETGARWTKQIPGQHCFDKKINLTSIAICLVGDLEKSKPTAKQMSSLMGLIENLQKQYQIPRERVLLHKEVDKKSVCPGKYFPAKVIKSSSNSF